LRACFLAATHRNLPSSDFSKSNQRKDCFMDKIVLAGGDTVQCSGILDVGCVHFVVHFFLVAHTFNTSPHLSSSAFVPLAVSCCDDTRLVTSRPNVICDPHDVHFVGKAPDKFQMTHLPTSNTILLLLLAHATKQFQTFSCPRIPTRSQA
jgi:hypothetical protein